MADQPDDDSKTEPASERRIRDALDKGNTPNSRETAVLASTLALLAVLATTAAADAGRLVGALRALFDQADTIRLGTGADAARLLALVWPIVAASLAPAVVAIALAGIVAGLAQNRPRAVAERIRPKPSRLSPLAGWKRLFGRQAVAEFAKSLAKLAILLAAVWAVLQAGLDRLLGSLRLDPVELPAVMLGLAVRLVAAVVLAGVVLAAADLAWTRYQWRRSLRMTRQEVKDELRQSDGDPMVKARLRSLARDRKRRTMLAAVPRASVIVVNPTHYAVALSYDRARDAAPLVVAKGRDLIALRIRDIALGHAVPVVENRPLARALHDAVEVDQMIPPQFYQAVAEIILLVGRRAARR